MLNFNVILDDFDRLTYLLKKKLESHRLEDEITPKKSRRSEYGSDEDERMRVNGKVYNLVILLFINLD